MRNSLPSLEQKQLKTQAVEKKETKYPYSLFSTACVFICFALMKWQIMPLNAWLLIKILGWKLKRLFLVEN